MGHAVALLLVLAGWAGAARAADWPQLQGNSMRTGRTADSVAPPYRARWFWCGPNLTLRNRDS